MGACCLLNRGDVICIPSHSCPKLLRKNATGNYMICSFFLLSTNVTLGVLEYMLPHHNHFALNPLFGQKPPKHLDPWWSKISLEEREGWTS
jgi:hypothetical protein